MEDNKFFGLLGMLAFLAFLSFLGFAVWSMRQQAMVTPADVEKAREIVRRLGQ
ncbi:hypothetical protein KKE60_04345 [Patescibacteria group bacterium]|nr:hypothetical protein [Patescibacteria group bacterium]